MYMPKKPKHRKHHKGRLRGVATSGTLLNNGAYGLKAVTGARLTSRQIEAARKAIVRRMKRAGKLWIRVFPDISVSKKPIEVRMGKGKGSVDRWVFPVQPGRVIFELDGIPLQVAQEALSIAGNKLPLKWRFVTRISE